MSETAAARESESMARVIWRRFRRHRLAVIGVFVMLLVMAVVTVAPAVMHAVHGYDYALMIDKTVTHTPPSGAHPLGTDEYGRDFFTRLTYAGRISLGIGIVTALLASGFGTIYGAVSGYLGGRMDQTMMRFVDIMLSLPVLPLMVIMAAIDMHKIGLGMIADTNIGNMARIVFIITVFGWMGTARLVRAEILSLKERDFVEAARALGASHWRVLFIHLVPNALAPVIVSTTLAVGADILYESSLSFLSLGVRLPTPTWGNMLMYAKDYFAVNPALAIWPGVMILITVVCVNFIGDGLRDAMDPRQFMKR